MPHSQFDWHARIKVVEHEYLSVRVAVDRLKEVVFDNPGILGAVPKPRDLISADENLEGTYLVRMFAEFETGIRSYWKTLRPTRPPVEILLDSVAAKRVIPYDLVQNAHAVRDYRNQLVHDRDEPVDVVTIRDARSHLSKYLARLPTRWSD